MKHALLKMKLKDGKDEAVRSFLQDLEDNHADEIKKIGEASGLLVDSYFLAPGYLYVFKKTSPGGGAMHLTRDQLAESALMTSFVAWTEECVESMESIPHVVSFE